MEPRIDRFGVLGIAPTLDRGAIKRAYFEQLPRHAPHADPEGFRRLRDAYETLMGPGLVGAWALAKVDTKSELASLERELGSRIAAAKQRRDAAEAQRRVVAAFVALLRLDLASASTRAGLDRKQSDA